MKVLLIRPPIVTDNPRNLGRISTGVPIGLLSVAASAEAAGHEVRVLDAVVTFDIHARHGQFQSLLAEDREAEIHFGASWEVLKGAVEEYSPDVVGIGNQYSDYVIEAVETARKVKEIDRRIVTVVGGPHATVSPETFVFPGSPVDFAVLGEGERAFVDLLASLSSGIEGSAIDGVASLDSDSCRYRPPSYIDDLDSLPLPAYHLVDMERYFVFEELGYRCRSSRASHSPRSLSVITSRGCPHRCIFCSIHLHMGRRWRPNSIGYVLDQVETVVKRHRVAHVYFEDDNLTVDRKRFEGILDGIRERGLSFTWSTPNGVRADGLDRDLLKKCRDTGCLMLGIGVESGDQRVLDQVVRKRLDLAKVVEVARLCREVRIDLHAFFVIGMPGETREEIQRSVDFALRLAREHDALPCVSIAKPLIGTEMYRICEERGYLTDPIPPMESLLMREQDICMRPMIRTEEFDLSDLERIYFSYYGRLVTVFRNRLIRGLLVSPSLWMKSVREVIIQLRRCGLRGIRLAARAVAAVYWERLYAR